MSGWIPIDESKPSGKQRALGYLSSGKMEILDYDTYYKRWRLAIRNQESGEKITHWLPINKDSDNLVKWVDSDDRLPEHETEVLTLVDAGKMLYMHTFYEVTPSSGQAYWLGDAWNYKLASGMISAWALLPDPPEEL